MGVLIAAWSCSYRSCFSAPKLTCCKYSCLTLVHVNRRLHNLSFFLGPWYYLLWWDENRLGFSNSLIYEFELPSASSMRARAHTHIYIKPFQPKSVSGGNLIVKPGLKLFFFFFLVSINQNKNRKRKELENVLKDKHTLYKPTLKL